MGVGDSGGDKVRAKGGGDHGWDSEWRGDWSDQPVTSGLGSEFYPGEERGRGLKVQVEAGVAWGPFWAPNSPSASESPSSPLYPPRHQPVSAGQGKRTVLWHAN